ncbi:hypothetical protein PK35_04425 [Tamlana nanhaiensis]|uniref:Uncharacterized protein n=1 Tax=Neotamlana nanhaiensis TaxID=1382798 RepID=A0A0D7W5L2_9FLAO|nr:hypothetical protein [Tamlana nanhaiensis]KJD33988.1 hypothetical protein PK35_04425 [Tamlana nanhaiensis]
MDTIEVADMVNINQLGHDKYSLIEIDSKGIYNEIQNDNVAEFTANSQFYIQQDFIQSKFLKRHSDKEANVYELSLRENLKMFNGLDKEFKNKSEKEKLEEIYNFISEINPKFSAYILQKINETK